MTVTWTLDPELRALLVCPLCRSELIDVDRGLLCANDRVVFPVEDGVPLMVRECALRAEPEELGPPASPG